MPTALGWNLIAMPSTPPAPQSVEFSAVDIVGASYSPFTGQGQFYDWQAGWLEATITMPPLTQLQAPAWVGFMMALRGQLNVFQLGDPLHAVPAGTAAGTPLVNGASQTGYSLATRGWTPSQAAALQTGDWIQIGYRLYCVTALSPSDGSGLAALSVWPQLRESPNDGAPIIVTGTKGLWRLKANARKWSETQARNYGMNFEIREAL
jgi:hypothetical protein